MFALSNMSIIWVVAVESHRLLFTFHQCFGNDCPRKRPRTRQQLRHQARWCLMICHTHIVFSWNCVQSFTSLVCDFHFFLGQNSLTYRIWFMTYRDAVWVLIHFVDRCHCHDGNVDEEYDPDSWGEARRHGLNSTEHWKPIGCSSRWCNHQTCLECPPTFD